jgi:WD40 repeat protein
MIMIRLKAGSIAELYLLLLKHQLILSKRRIKMKKYLYIYIIIILSFMKVAFAQPFVDLNPFIQYQNGLIVLPQWGDIDGDGKLDVLGERFIYKNQGDGTFPILYIWPVAMMPYYNGSIRAVWGDYDNDGDLDFVASWQSSTDNSLKTRIFHNEHRDTIINMTSFYYFTEIDAGLVGVYDWGFNREMAWGDYDNDGDLDLIVTGAAGVDPNYNPVSKIYRNDNGVFTDINANLMGVRMSSVAWGDYDKDGDLDLVITGNATPEYAASPFTKIYRNDDGIFVPMDIINLENLEDGMLAWADYDQDGYLDLIVSGTLGIGTPKSSLYHNNKDGTFTKIDANIPNFYWGDIVWGDLENDGDLDLIMSGEPLNDSTGVYRNDNGIFVKIDSLRNGRSAALSLGDYDNDGDLDILMANFNIYSNTWTENFTAYRNDINRKNTIPSVPGSLKSKVNGRNCTLSWDSSTDPETKTATLNYNLRIGRVSNGVDVCSPMSLVPTGQRLLPNFGNVGMNNTWTIKNLPDGKYYWSVQSIDNGLAASPFALEQTFIIGNVPEEDTLKILYPNGGEIFTSGDKIDIKWTGLAIKDTITLSYSLDAGANWNLISDKAVGGKLNWTVPDTPSTQCLAKISSFEKIDPRIIERLDKYKPQVVCARYSNDGTKLLTVATDTSIRVWDIGTQNQLLKMNAVTGNTGPWWGHYSDYADYSYDNSRIVSVQQFIPVAFVAIWDAKDGTELARITVKNDQYIVYAALSPDNKTLAVADGIYIKIYNVYQMVDSIAQIDTRDGSLPWYMTDLKFSPDGKFLAASSYDSTAKLWDTKTWNHYYSFKHGHYVYSVNFSPDSKWLLTSCIDGTIQLWDILKHSQISSYYTGYQPRDASFNSDATKILGICYGPSEIFDVKTKRLLAILSDNAVSISGRFSPDSKYAVISDSVAKIWELNPVIPTQDLSDGTWTIKPKDTGPGFASLQIDSFRVNIKDQFEVPIRLRNTQNLGSATGFETTISFNSNLLYPIDGTPMGVLNGDNREIKLQLPVQPISEDKLIKLRFEAMLGNDTATAIKFSDSKAIGGNVIVEQKHGFVNIINVCKDGAIRLVGSGNLTNSISINPNPAGDNICFNLILGRKNYVSLSIYNLIGEELINKNIGEMPSGSHDLNIPSELLSSGTYIAKIRIGGEEKALPLLINK